MRFVEIEWNNTSLETALMCGERFRRQVLEKEHAPSGPPAIRGTAVHRAVRGNFIQRLEEGIGYSPSQARDEAASAFEAAWAGGVALTEEDLAEGVGHVKGHQKDAAVALSELHAVRVAPGVQPLAVEERIVVKPRGADLVIHGTLDLQQSLADGVGIRDVKTRERSPARNEADKSRQLTMYSLLAMAKYGRPPARIVMDNLIRTPKTLAAQYVPQETARDGADMQAYINRLGAMVEAVKRGVFIPARPYDDWFCSPKWCPFWRTCRYVNGAARPAGDE